MAVLRKSLAKNAVVTNAQGAAPISLAEHRARKQTRRTSAHTGRKNAAGAQNKTGTKKKTASRSSARKQSASR
jgi:hypothetical protein